VPFGNQTSRLARSAARVGTRRKRQKQRLDHGRENPCTLGDGLGHEIACEQEPWRKVRGHTPCRKEAMPDKHAQTRRPAPIPYRPPQGRTEELRALAAASGLSTNAFITACVFGDLRRRSTAEPLSESLDRTAQIADLLHDLSIAGAADAKALEAVQDELSALRAALLTVSGRKP